MKGVWIILKIRKAHMNPQKYTFKSTIKPFLGQKGDFWIQKANFRSRKTRFLGIETRIKAKLKAL